MCREPAATALLPCCQLPYCLELAAVAARLLQAPLLAGQPGFMVSLVEQQLSYVAAAFVGYARLPSLEARSAAAVNE